jgi:hypothetical protein
MNQFSDYLCGGYFLSRPERSGYNDPPFPDSYLSISRDIRDFVPDSWLIEWAHKYIPSEENSKKFDLKPEAYKELAEWATEHINKDFGAWTVIFELEKAQYLRNRFLSHLTDVTIFGIGLHKTLCENFLETTTPPPPQPGFAPVGEMGTHTSIKQKHLLPNGGVALGFELINHEKSGLSTSWLDVGLEKNAQEMKIPINKFGLIENFEDALKYKKIIDGKIKPFESVMMEPGPWLPWLLVDYTKV